MIVQCGIVDHQLKPASSFIELLKLSLQTAQTLGTVSANGSDNILL